jgi:signal transduction histidine kinase
VLPPWYRTWWAYALYILLFLISVWGFVKWRIHAVKQENKALEEKVITRTKELEHSLEERYNLSKKIESQQALINERLRISRDLHDDIGSTLGSISIYSDVAKNRTEKNETASEVLSKIGVASREIIEKMSDIVWSLNPDNDSFEQLQNRMMAFAAMILAPRNILHEFNADEELKNVRLTSEHRKNIFLIFKEALYNTVKYADCNKVRITLNSQKNDLTMVIQDNGKGFDVSKAIVNQVVIPAGEYVGGNGIKSMYARADDIKASLSINSKTGEGTTVQLIVNV